MKSEIDSPTRRQPRRAVRAKKVPIIESSGSEHMSSAGGGTRKRTSRAADKLPEPKRARGTKGGKARAIKELEKRVSAMNHTVALSKQLDLLGNPVAPADAPPDSVFLATPEPEPAAPEPATPKSAKGRRGRPRKKRAEELYMDEFLDSDADEAAQAGQGESSQVRWGNRWIPDMENRRRVAGRPKGVPFQLWMSYCFLDDYMYRHSLTEEELLKLPLLDDVLVFQSGGEQPAAPEGYQWDERKHLVPIPKLAYGTVPT